jgi:prepilin-type N-terminal cleavage/methylation domain-containing protein
MRKSGFTLIEVLVAMVLLAAVGGVTLQVFTNTARVTQDNTAAFYSVGRTVLEEIHERVRADQWGNGGWPTNPPGLPGPQPRVFNLGGAQYTATWVVTPNPDGNGGDYRRVTVTVQ